MARKIPKMPDGLKYTNVQGVIPGNDYQGRGALLRVIAVVMVMANKQVK